jgi:hypothetical protein
MTVALELIALQDRAAQRVYHALAWVCARAGRDPTKRLAGYARLLNIEPDQARSLEAQAGSGRSVRIGRDTSEQLWLRQALAELAQTHPTLAAAAAPLAARVAPVAPTRRPNPFEESAAGPPLVFARPIGA